jgi:hypothetical protein
MPTQQQITTTLAAAIALATGACRVLAGLCDLKRNGARGR